MPSDPDIEVIKVALADPSSCSAGTTAILKDLFDGSNAKSQTATTSGVGSRATSGAKGSKRKADKRVDIAQDVQNRNLQPRERTRLATEVVNICLKSLSQELQHRLNPRQSPQKNTLRPLEPRSSNVLPLSTTKSAKSSVPIQNEDGKVAVAECARIALAVLRKHEDQIRSQAEKGSTPELQVEQAMSSLIGKLISLDMVDLACKEARLLMRRLDMWWDKDNTTAKMVAKSDGMKKTLVEILIVESALENPNKLSLVVTTQLQIIKLLQFTKVIPTPSSLNRALDLRTQASAAQCALRTAVAQGDDKCARHLGNLARAIMAVTDRISMYADQLEDKEDPHAGVLELRIRSIEILWYSWTIAKHKIQIKDQVYRPLIRFINHYLSTTHQSAVQQLNLVIKMHGKVYALFDSDQFSTEQRTDCEAGEVDIAQILQPLARAAGDSKRTQQYVDKQVSNLKNVKATSACKAGLLCLTTGAILQDAASLALSHLSYTTRTALNLLIGAPEGTEAEMNNMLIGVTSLRKGAVSILSKRTPQERKEAQLLDPELRDCIFEAIRCTLHFLGDEPIGKDKTAKAYYERRRTLARKVASGAIESIATLPRFMSSDQIPISQLYERLEDCLILGARLELDTQSSTMSILVLVSNAYYFHFLLAKQSGRDDPRLMAGMERAVMILKDCTPAEQDAALMPEKLHRLAHMYEQQKEWSKAVTIYHRVFQYLVNKGTVKLAAERLAWTPRLHYICLDSELSLLGKVLDGLTRIAWKDTPGEALTLPKADLSIDLQGFVLELQLDSVVHFDAVSKCGITIKDTVMFLSKMLLATYTNDERPVRRLRSIASLAAYGYLEVPTEEEDVATAKLDHIDRILLPYAEHYLARRNAMLGMIHLKKSRLLREALQQWHSILHGVTTNSMALSSKIDDIEWWQRTLMDIATYTYTFGLSEHRAIALDLLISTTSTKTSEKEAFTLRRQKHDLAIELHALGYLDDAIKLLQNSVSNHIDDEHIEEQIEQSLMIAESDFIQDKFELAWAALDRAYVWLNKIAQGSALAKSASLCRLRGQFLNLTSQRGLKFGQYEYAVAAMKKSIQYYSAQWRMLEQIHGTPAATKKNGPGVEDSSCLGDDHDQAAPMLDLKNDSSAPSTSKNFCKFARPLFDALVTGSTLMLHCGAANEGRHYVKQALEISRKINAPILEIRALHALSQLELRSSNIELGVELYGKAQLILNEATYLGSSHLALLTAQHAMRTPSHSTEGEKNIDNALEVIDCLEPLLWLTVKPSHGACKSPTDDLPPRFAALKISKTPITKAKPTDNKLVNKKKSTATKSRQMVPELQAATNIMQDIKWRLLSTKAAFKLQSGKRNDAADLLYQARELRNAINQYPTPEQLMLLTKVRLEQALNSLQFDPVLNIVPEATLAHPATLVSNTSTNTIRKTRVDKKIVTSAKVSKSAETPDHALYLKQAMEASSSKEHMSAAAFSVADGHQWSDVRLASVLTSYATGIPYDKQEKDLEALSTLEFGRNIATLISQAAVRADKATQHVAHSDLDPSFSAEAMNSPVLNPEQFQAEYIDIIPKEWHVVSLSLNEKRDTLRLGTFRAGSTPFVLSIPLVQESNDNDFIFDVGKKELLRIIGLANYSCHEGVDLTKKGAKAEWWEARAALDSKLRDLLINVENIWFGGFKGLLRQASYDKKSLSRFSESFNIVLDKYLTSRRSKKGAVSKPVLLSPRVLELFVHLGDPRDNENIDASILDLLYFTIDTLWFNGEPNVGEEIDFDAMVKEVAEALVVYHEAAEESASGLKPEHTILILDKRLHAFPWESLPCMEGQSISRLPSLHFLRERILHMQDQGDQKRLVIDAASGSYILNPSGDLTNTQSTFQKPLAELRSWSSLVNTAPTEEQISTALSSKSLYMYFGHGSGGQYVRSRTVRRLDRCAVALLMGCSSGALTEADEFECYGTPMNYLHAGSPAVVGSLWDVTDKDIDRFSAKMLEGWGLFSEKEAPIISTSPVKRSRKAKGKQTQPSVEGTIPTECTPVSLDAAVAKARSSCIMRYLNGAAPVVYGIPVMLSWQNRCTNEQ